MPVVDELIGLLGFRIQGEQNLQKFKAGMNDAEKGARRSAGVIGKMGAAADNSVLGVGRLGGALAAVGAGAIAKQAIVGFADYDRKISRIGITAGATVEQTNAAGEALRGLATKFAIPVDEARQGLDSLVSSGMNLKEGMSFLEPVLKVAQASGATTNDIANTAQKASSAFGLSIADMGQAFDTMVAGGKLGQFELKDMASYLPSLSAQFAALGYKGQDGLRRLIAMLQTARIQTGTAAEAATNAENLFGKIYSEETAKKFKKAGVNLRKEMEKGNKAGKDTIETFIDLVNVATKGDMKNLPLLFEDTQVRKMVTALVQLKKEWGDIYRDLDPKKTAGSTQSDLNRIMGDTASSIQRAENAWLRFQNVLGKGLAPAATTGLNAISEAVEKQERAAELRKRMGAGKAESTFGFLGATPDEVSDAYAYEKAKQSYSHLYAKPGAEPGIPSILSPGPHPTFRLRNGRNRAPQAPEWADPPQIASPSRPPRTPFGLGGFGILKYGPGQSAADTINQSVRDMNGESVTTKFLADVASFTDPANQAHKLAMDLDTSITTRFFADISDIETKVARAKELIGGVPSFSGGGISTPPRVIQSGAAP